MTYLTNRGEPFTGTVERDEKGLPMRIVKIPCDRCHVIGGERLWIMGIENGSPYSRTGFSCWTCGNTGVRREAKERFYTPAEYASLEKRRATIARKRHEKDLAAEAARNAVFDAWFLAHEHVVGQIVTFGGDRDDVIENSIKNRVIPPSWRLDSGVLRVLKLFAEQELKATSGYVGEVGERVTLKLSCERLLGNYAQSRFDPPFYIALLRDENGNRVVYKGGTPPLCEGEEGVFKATVKAHEERGGEKQTIIARAREVEAAVTNYMGTR